ncbi:hypothetical protein [Seonamhaeicola sp.]|uniref:hypothetical protein n=1 Tax=Seonamhaeicola sp. TaxID=1912245 RepID=UPI003569E356
MSDKKHIDRLFQESFKDFEATPSDAVWKNIEANLNKKKKKRVIPIWWRYAGVAALLLLSLTIGGFYFNKSSNTDPIEVVTEEDNNTHSLDLKNSNTPNELNKKNSAISNSKENNEALEKLDEALAPSNNSVPENKTSIAKSSETKTKNNNGVDEKLKSNFTNNQNNKAIAKSKETNNQNKTQNNINNNALASIKPNEEIDDADTLQNKSTKNNSIAQTKNKVTEKQNQTVTENKEEKAPLTIEEALEENNELLEETKKPTRWAVTPNAAPVYFNTLGQGSSLDPQFNNNSKTGEVNMSYGITASYALNNKVSVRTGINKLNLGYNTNDVVIVNTAGVVQSSLRNVKEGTSSNTASNNVSLVSEATINKAPQSLTSTNTTINQAFGYIEIPLEIQYAVINKKLGLNVIGGFSSFFLNDNEIYSETETGSRVFLGEANNLNKVSYSANFGLGLNYKFTKKIDLNLEPMFKYQFNTFNNTSGNFTPYFIGVYTGFAIKF